MITGLVRGITHCRTWTRYIFLSIAYPLNKRSTHRAPISIHICCSVSRTKFHKIECSRNFTGSTPSSRSSSLSILPSFFSKSGLLRVAYSPITIASLSCSFACGGFGPHRQKPRAVVPRLPNLSPPTPLHDMSKWTLDKLLVLGFFELQCS